MEGKLLKQTLASLDNEEKRMLKTFSSKALKIKQQELSFEKLCHRRNQKTANQEGVRLEVG